MRVSAIEIRLKRLFDSEGWKSTSREYYSMNQATRKNGRMWVLAVGIQFLAANSALATGWLPSPVTINRIQVTPTGGVVLYIDGPNSCPNDVNHRLEYSTTASAAKMVYAGLLAAQAQNRPMQFYISDCVGEVATFTYIEG